MGMPAGARVGAGLNVVMPDATPVRRPRRWWRVVRAVLLTLVVMAALAFCFAPTIGLWMAQGHLPFHHGFHHGSITVRRIALEPLAEARPEAQIVASAAVSRALASAASRRWIPPGLLRGGQNAVGELSLPILREQAFRWQVLVAGSEPMPLACLHVSHVDLTEFLHLNGQTVLTVAGTPVMRCIYRVDWGRITDDDEPGQSPLVRRQLVVARGTILLIAGQAQRTLRVDRLAGHAWTTFTPVPQGYHLGMRVAIEEADAEPITLPIIGDARPLLMKQLEDAANDGLARGLEGVVLPPWFPTTVRVDATVD